MSEAMVSQSSAAPVRWFRKPWTLLVFLVSIILFLLRKILVMLRIQKRMRSSTTPTPTPPTPHSGTADDNLDSDFQAACQAAKQLKSLDMFQQLRLYAYFKQATVGPCNADRPSALDLSGCAKWDAWKGMGELSSLESKEMYIAMVSELQGKKPVTSSSKPANQDDGGLGFKMGPSMSRMAYEPEEAKDKDIWIYAGEGDIEKVAEQLKNHVDIDAQDPNGLTPLHFAVDRGKAEMVEFLLKQRANIDVQDEDLCTPLHTAVTCDRVDMVKLLLQAGANQSLVDTGGKTPIDEADDAMKTVFANFSKNR